MSSVSPHARLRLLLILVLVLTGIGAVAGRPGRSGSVAQAASIAAQEGPAAAANADRPHTANNITFTTKVIFDSASAFTGASSFDKPTVLAFGPDNRLYVGQFDGHIYALTINFSTYEVTAVQVINAIYNTPNFNDDGSPAPNVLGRQLIGLVFDPDSTAAAPIMYVSHSDIRYAIANDAAGTDTHSGTITRLSGPNYDQAASRKDVITGLPRSRENHSTTSIVWNTVNPTDKWLYIAQGSNTNNGAPSNHFSNLPEYYLSAAILRANVKDPSFNTIDLEGVTNASSLAAFAGKFEMYATGYRNAYDMIWHSNGKLYANVNGGNNGFGDTPAAAAGCPGGVEINPGYLNDQLRIVTPGSYGGHPNPARGECVLNDGVQQGLPRPSNYVNELMLYHGRPSTNGIMEYRASAFGGEMIGDLIVATYGQNQDVSRIQLNPDGSVQAIDTLATFRQPLDVIADPAGTIFIAEFGGDAVTILKPATVANCPPAGAPSDTVDTDQDGYTDQDEVDNGTDECSQASFPADFDKAYEFGAGNVFKRSDLNDPDDDNDGIPDVSDQLYFDRYNGTQTTMPVVFNWNPEDAPLGKVANSGFTGVQINSTNAVSRTMRQNISVGAAGGFMSLLSNVGTNAGATNSQVNALQIGFNAQRPFKIETRVTEPFIGRTPDGNQSVGLFMGQDEDNYIKLVVSANKNGNASGGPGIQFARETAGVLSNNPTGNNPSLTLPYTGNIDLRLTGNPVTKQVQAFYRVGATTSALPWVLIGTLSGVPDSYFTTSLPAGLLSTHNGTNTPISFVLDFFKIEYNDMVARINSGGPAQTVGGATWSEDSDASHPYAVGGATYVLSSFTCPNILNTTDDVLYCSERSGGKWSPFSYSIPITTSGQYRVRMHFAEIYHGISNANGVGARVFDVKLENATVLHDFDIFAQAGGAARAITRTFDVQVSDGALNIVFDATLATSVDQGKVSAIEVWGPILAINGGGTATPSATVATPTTVPTATSTAVTPTATTGTPTISATATVASPTATTSGTPVAPTRLIWMPFIMR
jgi:glucose/arabinose dehydrogenase